MADAADYRPPLTTVRQEFDELGAAAVTALVHGIEHGAHGMTTVPARLVVRASTAAAAARSLSARRLASLASAGRADETPLTPASAGRPAGLPAGAHHLVDRVPVRPVEVARGELAGGDDPVGVAGAARRDLGGEVDAR